MPFLGPVLKTWNEVSGDIICVFLSSLLSYAAHPLLVLFIRLATSVSARSRAGKALPVEQEKHSFPVVDMASPWLITQEKMWREPYWASDLHTLAYLL